MIRVVHPGSRIRMLTFSHPGFRIPDPGFKKSPNPGSGSATLRTTVAYYSVLRIHDILVWIRIRGSMTLTNGSGS
jgi:hypothetical protein